LTVIARFIVWHGIWTIDIKKDGVKAAGSMKAAEFNSALLINRSHRSVINLSIAISGRKDPE